MKKFNLLLAVILFFGLAIRLYKINIPLLEFEPSRQIQTAEIAKNLFYDGFKVQEPNVGFLGPGKVIYAVEFPGFNLAVALLYQLNGTVNETLGRLFSVLGWVISFYFLSHVSKRFIGERFTLITMLFYSLSPMSIFVSRSFQPDQWMLTLSLGAIFFALTWMDKGRLIYFMISIVFASLSSLLKIPSFIFTVTPIILLINYQKSKRKVFYIFFYLGASLLPSAIWYLYAFFLHKSGSSFVGQENFSLSNWFWPGLFFKVKYYTTVFGWNYNQVILPIGFILFCIGIFSGSKKMRFLYIWLASIAVYFFNFNRHTMVHEYYNLPLLPVASIFIALGFATVMKVFKGRLFVYCFVVAVVVLNAVPQFLSRAYQPIERFKFVVETGREVTRVTKPGDLIIGAMDSGPTVVYYSNRHGWGFDITGNNNPPVDGKTLSPEEYLEYLRLSGAVIFAAADKERLLSNPNFSNYLHTKYKTLVNNKGYIIFDLASQN